MATSDHTHRRGHPLLVEGIVILASILVAFWLDGWRADREMDRDLTQELESVYREVQRNRDLVVAELIVLNRLTASADACWLTSAPAHDHRRWRSRIRSPGSQRPGPRPSILHWAPCKP